MANLEFNYHNPRAEKARLSAQLNKWWRLSLKLLLVLLILAGLLLLFVGSAFGWVLLGLIAVPVIILYWYKNDLSRLPIVNMDSHDMADIISHTALGFLPADPTPVDVATAVGQTSSGHFLALRFGLGPKFLQEIATSIPADVGLIWQNALEIRQQLGAQEISGGVLALSLIKAFPEYENVLARLQFDYDDLLDGVNWHNHLQQLVEQEKQPMKTGGIARDWSFGWTPQLQRYARNISQEISVQGGRTMSLNSATHQEVVSQMIDVFAGGGKQNVAIVGPDGAGKTSVVHDFAEKLLDASSKIPANLKFRQVFLLSSADLISAAPGKGELENLINELLIEAYSAKNVIICLDDAQMFFEEGTGSVDLTNLLLPILEGGAIRIILTINEQSLLRIGQKKPALTNALNRINIAPSNYKDTMAAMEDRAIQFEYHKRVIYMYQALKTAYNLAKRYVYDLAMPGQALKLLETAANYAEGQFVTAASVEQAIEKTLGVKVGVASVDTEKETLLNLEDKIHERMIDQTRAVQVVSDALRRARTGVRNQDRPIGTFLFLGPTGVGKTELAKALSEVYFNGEDHMVRIDLNQYVTNEDVANLTADGADNPNSLTAQVMKQPFSVVLLDEIEKAHPNVLTALLQVLDEGILRDAKGREVSFKDAIVIATSNAGAERIREYIERGYNINQFEDQFIDELISSKQFRPEFLNRFDEIVLFKPLGKPELAQIADLIIAGVNKTMASQKVTVKVEPAAKDMLVEAGYDPRLGARPMRRVVQRVVENQVAKEMLSGQAGSGSTVVISPDDVQKALEDK
ncbi:ATP-dependent Clp protease ATP-binding subunit [Candidatus Saccharibacteria bacterium]|nr:ATP-dependent Clp protease ATP-binding subunit [Candidatus Saccharibacteria bacterium]